MRTVLWSSSGLVGSAIVDEFSSWEMSVNPAGSSGERCCGRGMRMGMVALAISGFGGEGERAGATRSSAPEEAVDATAVLVIVMESLGLRFHGVLKSGGGC